MQQKELNGWNLEQFQSVVSGKMVEENPEAGRLSFQTRKKWDDGFGVDGHTEKIGMLDQTIPLRFTLRGDHPPELLGRIQVLQQLRRFWRLLVPAQLAYMRLRRLQEV